MVKAFNLHSFSIPITYGSFGEEARELNKKLVEDIFHYNDHSEKQLRSGVDVAQTKPDLEEHYSSFNVLGGLIASFSEGFIKWSGVATDFIKVKQFWANVNKSPYAFHMPHSHGVKDSLFTGVYFPSSGIFNDEEVSKNQNLDENPKIISSTQPEAGSLVLLDPLENIKTAVATSTTIKYPFFGNPICIEPKESTIVIFPSYLCHMVTPTKKENFTRISIAFNIEVAE